MSADEGTATSIRSVFLFFCLLSSFFPELRVISIEITNFRPGWEGVPPSLVRS